MDKVLPLIKVQVTWFIYLVTVYIYIHITYRIPHDPSVYAIVTRTCLHAAICTVQELQAELARAKSEIHAVSDALARLETLQDECVRTEGQLRTTQRM